MSKPENSFMNRQEAISQRQKELVQSSFVMVIPIQQKASDLFYTKLFELDPSLKPLFKGDIKSQGEKLMTTLAAAVKGLDHMESLLPILQELGERHVTYGVIEAHYDTVEDALLYTLEMGLGDYWSEEMKVSWRAVYKVLANAMKGF